ncbi:alkylation response protein AidB-like acyl-CoA dehydrogenase [Pseudonocardia sediminis]|uniref:Alkylation response protein AidB-like acyl-CoA dehydrogenase n=1 Tax=Pseudonocardia sediminis TaxID=1397368 RepID=A0A4Q7V3P1_PSEST|nr:acyl-CoA dehydrogenase family protein [Pseudonocardia sediminis]RZT87313.1 alkylation response protein AidB-like acyl-CoA dehydrogenase [Pseudonocardia sediminis]
MTDSVTTEVEQTVDAYLTRSFDAQRRLALVDARAWDPTFLDEVQALGWFALAVPESAGGLGMPLSAAGAAMLPLGRHLVPGPMIEQLVLPALLLRHIDEGDARRAELAGAVVALVDPEAHGSWSRDGDRVRVRDGHLSGDLTAVRFGREADLLVAVADSPDGPQVHLLGSRSAAVTVQPAASADPTASLATVTFVPQAGAPAEPVLAGRAAERFLTEMRAWARILAACELSGIATALLETTTAFVQVREQFGRPIGSFQAVKHVLADMHALACSLRNVCDSVLADAVSACPDDLSMLAAVAKAFAADAALEVCESAVQMHGGAGFTTETDLHLYYKRALALRAWYGDHEELAHRIGDALLTGSHVHESRNVS